MQLVITEINDYFIAGELHGHTSGDMTPMLVAHIEGCFLFSTQINLVEAGDEGAYSFKKVMGKNDKTPYAFWKSLPSNVDLVLSVEEKEIVVNKAGSGKFSHDADFVSKLQDGYVIVQGGGFNKPILGDPEKLERLLSLAESKAKFFKKLFGIDLWLSDGNLLGLVRDGQFFSHDKDVDMSYVSTQPTLSGFKEEYKYIIRTLKENGQRISFWRKNGTLRQFPMWHDDVDPKLLFDVFPAWLDPKKKKFIGQKQKYFDCVKDDFFPLQEKEVYGHKFLIPKCPERYLASAYGHNWDKIDNLYKGRSRPLEERRALRSILLGEDGLIGLHSMEEDKSLTLPKRLGSLAFKDLKNRIGFSSSSADILAEVAMLFECDGREDIAVPILEKVAEIWPNNITYRRKLEEIKNAKANKE